MVEYLGSYNNLALFTNGELSAVVDVDLNMVTEFGALSSLQPREWSTQVVVADAALELAAAALITIEKSLTASAGRMYTIPDGVKNEAIKALKWRKEEKRGGTPVGLNTARTLAKGGQIGITKVRHIAKYFPRHEVDKKGKGWEPGEDNFPSNGRIAWALWGGDAAWRWAQAIVERENKKSVTAGGYDVPGYDDHLDLEDYGDSYDSELDAFKSANNLDASYGPEFIVRVCLDGSGIDRLYKIEIDGRVYVWDDCSWDNLGHVEGDIYTYDASLDEPYDRTERTHLLIDSSSAVIISAMLQESPYKKVQIEDLDSEEAMMMADAMPELDYTMLDRVLTAAGEGFGKSTSKVEINQDGNYTPEERSAKASNQPRNADGQFAKAGADVQVGEGPKSQRGTITNVDSKTGNVGVKLQDGRTINVPAKYTKAYDAANAPLAQMGGREVDNLDRPLDTSGILAEPRTPINMPKAHLPGTLPPLDATGVRQMLTDWDGYVQKQRGQYKPANNYDKSLVQSRYGVNKFAGENSIIAAGEKEEVLTPQTSDVAPKYIAIVSPNDPAAVMDFVALVPKTATTATPITYKRDDGAWVQDDQILKDLQSATPPPVVVLDTKELVNTVLLQVDKLKNVGDFGDEPADTEAAPATPAAAPAAPTEPATTAASAFLFEHLVNFWMDTHEALTAAGGLDRNRGNAEALRRYWTRGKGGAKIRWGVPGDWTRCVRQLSKYMGPRAKGYCQLRHKEMTGVYTGSKFNVGKSTRNNFSSLFSSEEDLIQKTVEKSALYAAANELKEKVGLVAGAYKLPGARFSIELLIPEELESGDGRSFLKDSIKFRDLPLPLLWQIKTSDGHAGSVVVGRIDYMERTDRGIGNAYGVFDSGPYGREAQRLVENGFLRGVSADLDQFEAKEDKSENSDKENDDEISKKKLTINHARVMAATIVAKPAFQECTITIDEAYPQQEDRMIPDDGIYEESINTFVAAEALTASGFLDSPIPVTPPREWFQAPGLTKPTPITVDPNGRVYGHIAAWHVNHIGMPRSTKPPRSRSKYAYFHTGVCRTDDGFDMPVGQLTLAGGHAPLNADAVSAAKHYDDTASAIADVHAGEDEHGIWVAGSLRPNANEMQIRALRASAPSGDWRPINGSLELVAVCQVNVPGFPIARAMVASGKIMALVAAGASYFAIMKSQHVTNLVDRAAKLNELSASVPDLKSRVKTIRASITTVDDLRQRALTAAAVSELAKFSDEDRKDLAKKGHALADGSYPIRNKSDLKNAIQAFGRANEEDRAKVKKHIIKRAKQLKLEDLIPDKWNYANALTAAANLEKMREVIASLSLTAAPAVPGVNAPGATEEDIEELKEAKDDADRQTAEEIQAAEDIKAGKTTVEDTYDEDGRIKFTPKTQPRDARGKYRKVLARLRQDLGVAGLQDALKKAQEAEDMDFAGNYTNSAAASSELLGMLDRLNTKALNPKALENVRSTARELGRVMSNLPLPFGEDADKLRFSDLPSGLKDLVENMVDRVGSKIGKEDADIATANLRSFMSGGDYYSQGEVQSEMSKMLRLLT
jgi:hypothetical protein